MAGPITTRPDDGNPDLLLRLLRAEIARNLKADLMKVAEAQVDDAVSRAVESLELKLRTEVNQVLGERLIKVMLEKRADG